METWSGQLSTWAVDEALGAALRIWSGLGCQILRRISQLKHLHPSSQSFAGMGPVLEAEANSTTHFAVTEAHSLPHVAMGRGILEGSQREGDICSSWKKDQEAVRI